MTGRWQRHRASLLVGLGLLLAVVVVLVLGGGAVSTSTPLDPDNPEPGGAQAVARVLADHGVEVTVARGADALERADVGAGTTVLVTSSDQLGRSTTRRLLDATRGADVVVAAAGPGLTRALGVDRPPSAVSVRRPRDAHCADTTYDGLRLEVDRALAYPGPGGCFGGPDGSLLLQARPGLTLLGAADALANDQVLRADDAAVVLRLLGRHPRLVWYVPTIDDLVGGDGVSLQTLLPRWVRPGLWLGGVAVVALVLWRGRRLGALATEPLPVVVKAIETTRSRGRLYRRAGDRGHAAEALRRAARQRLAERLRLGSPDPDTLVRDVARHTGRPADEVRHLLGPDAPAPGHDRDLVALAGRLAALEEEVRLT
ncbi:MAG: DUF4350 domain-containing protein [Nocardioidaceae bacterium]